MCERVWLVNLDFVLLAMVNSSFLSSRRPPLFDCYIVIEDAHLPASPDGPPDVEGAARIDVEARVHVQFGRNDGANNLEEERAYVLSAQCAHHAAPSYVLLKLIAQPLQRNVLAVLRRQHDRVHALRHARAALVRVLDRHLQNACTRRPVLLGRSVAAYFVRSLCVCLF